MTIALAVITIVVAAIGFIKVIHTISSGFTKVELGQDELKEDFRDLKTEMKDTNTKLIEMEKDIVWVQASTKTPPRNAS